MTLALDRLLSRPCLHVAVDMQRLFAEQAAVATTAEVLGAWDPAGGES